MNADDFGLSPGINRGIIEAHRDGIVTSASLMAVGDAFEEAVASHTNTQAFPSASTSHSSRAGPYFRPHKVPSWSQLMALLPVLGRFLLKWLTGQIRMKDVEREFAAQIEKAMDQGVRVDKLDSHIHVHLLPGIFQVVQAVALRLWDSGDSPPKERISWGGGITLGWWAYGDEPSSALLLPSGSPHGRGRSLLLDLTL